MTEADYVHLVTRVVEVVGTAIIVVGSFGALVVFLVNMARAAAPRETLVASFRSNLGRSIVLGLEFLVAADIINTVAVEPTIQSLIVLAGIVLIRTFLSFSRDRGALAVAEGCAGAAHGRLGRTDRSRVDRNVTPFSSSARIMTWTSPVCTDVTAIRMARSAANTATRS